MSRIAEVKSRSARTWASRRWIVSPVSAATVKTNSALRGVPEE